ncbi:MAG: peroxidase family protein [Hyphomicrobiaceae bacterium]
MSALKPFVINLNDLAFLLNQVGFVPLFDELGNAVVDWDGTSPVRNSKGELIDLTGLSQQQAWDLYGTGFPHVSSPIGIRDVTGFHNNLFGTQADWGAVDQVFRRDIAADFSNYRKTDGAQYGTTVDEFGVVTQSSVIDLMPRIISRTITTGGVNLLTDVNGHFVVWDKALYENGSAVGLAYKALIDASGADTTQNLDGSYVKLVDGVKIVVPLTTEVAILDNNGAQLIWNLAEYQASVGYTVLLASYSNASLGGLKDATGGTLEAGETIHYRAMLNPTVLQNTGVAYDPDLLAYKQLIDANLDFSAGIPADDTPVVTTLVSSGYGLLETLGHIDFQNPTSGEFFIGSENPGVAPVNSWFGIFGQFFDHGLDLIGKGGQGTSIKINFAADDPLFGALGPDGQAKTFITVGRATVDSMGANGPDYVNHTSPFIDQSQTYGSVDQITQLLRKWEPDADGLGYHAGMEMFDGETLADAWMRKVPVIDPLTGVTTIVETPVHHTLPTLSELRDHVLDTNRVALTWEDVADYRNRSADGTELAVGNSGHALILDMNTRFDAAHLASTQAVGTSTVAQLVTGAVAVLGANLGAAIAAMPGYAALNGSRSTTGDTFTQALDGSIHLHLATDLEVATGPTTSMTLYANDSFGAPIDYSGASALFPWVDFSNFSIMSPPPVPGSGDPDVHDAVGQILMASVGDHYIAGDGRVNENFGLTSIHHVFHEEHNFQVENLKTWIYAHDTNNPGATDDHEQLHNWQDVTAFQDDFGNYMFNAAGKTEVLDGDGLATGLFVANADNIAWNDDKMFNATKLIVEMEYQHAAVDQYARTITPRIQEFVGYSTGVDPTVSLEYSQVAFRFGHSTIRETIDTIDPSGWMLGNVTKYALEKAFLNPQTFADEGVAAITLGLSRQQMNEVDEFITPALNQGLLGQPLDLPAINLARGRDLGIPTLNAFRAGLSLAEYTSWSDFGANMVHPESLANFIAAYSFSDTSADPLHMEPISVSQDKAQYILDRAAGLTPAVNPFVTVTVTITDEGPVTVTTPIEITSAQARAFLANQVSGNAVLDAVSGNFDMIDAWIGGLAEAHVPGGLLGETFDAVFVAQIQSLMDGDRFYYLYRLFGTQIHEEVNNGQFKDIVERNTGLTHLNGSIFAYADKYYDFAREADGTEYTTAESQPYLLDENGDQLLDLSNQPIPNPAYHAATGDPSNHLYAATLAANPNLGIFSDGGASTETNGTVRSVIASDYVRADAPLQFINDVRPDLHPDQVHPLEGTPTDGADSHEVIVATKNADYIHARGGDDTVYGEDGDDYLFGDGGIDRLYGGDGNDVIDTGEGPDLADGGAGKDIIYGRGSGSEVGGFDQLVGGSGNDLVIGGEGIDKLSGGSGDDIIYGDGLTNPEMGNTDAFTHGGDGNDYIDTGASGDLLYGEEGDDYMVGGIDQDLIQGGDGDDILRPGSPSQAINGGPDEVIGDDGFGQNTGFDLMDLSDYAAGGPGVVAELVTQANPLVAGDGFTPFPAWFQMEGVVGTSGNDELTGDSASDGTGVTWEGSNWLIGGSGDDALRGNGGNDIIIGGSMRLDSIIGTYADADATPNAALGSAEWLADAMATGGTTLGYGNDTENGYTGASNRAIGPLQANGLIDAVNATGENFDKHFTEMLRSRMFKDVVLGDNGTDGTNDTAVFTGNRSDYTIVAVPFAPPSGGPALIAYKVTDNRTAADLVDAEGAPLLDANNDPLVNEGTDIVIGVESLQFADMNLALANKAPTGLPTITGADNILSADISAIADQNGLPAPADFHYQWQSSATGSTPWADVGGATAQTYAVTDGRFYRVVVSYTDTLGFSESISSQMSAKVGTNNADSLSGTADPNLLIGLNGIDTLIGGLGADTMIGGDGKDTYFVDNVGDLVIETNTSTNSNQFDTVRTMINYTLTENVENLQVEATATATHLNGNALGNTLNGILSTVAALTLDGGAGNDIILGSNLGHSTLIAGGTNPGGVDELRAYGIGNTLIGGDGNTYYYSESATDVILEANANAATGGNADRLTATYTVLNLANNVENLTLGGTAYFGGGNSLNNVIVGNASANVINGQQGRDTMIGLNGDDVYFVDQSNDVVTEASGAGSGTDQVRASANYTLAANVERLVVEGSTATSGTGNSLDNIIDGRSATQGLTLNGGAGNDTIFGSGAGSNSMIGGSGNGADVFFALGSNNTMTGGDGTDHYHSSSASDSIIETAGGGSDKQFVTYSGIAQLANNVENMTLEGASTGGTGNALLNTITALGLGQAATISGGLGNDIITGSGHDDTFIWNANEIGGTDGRDTINGGANTDVGDRFVINGNSQPETYTIYSNKDDWNGALPGNESSATHFTGYNGPADIIVTRAVGSGAASIIAQLTSIEEITINTTANTSPAGGIQPGAPILASGDTISVVGDFVPTGLNFNTITVNGSDGCDTVDITGLTSAHRIVLNTNGGADTIVGDLRPQDLIDQVSNAASGSVTSVEPVISWQLESADGDNGASFCIMPVQTARIDKATDSFVFDTSGRPSEAANFQPGDAIDLRPVFAALQLGGEGSASQIVPLFNAAGNLKVDGQSSETQAAADHTNDNDQPIVHVLKTAYGSDFG